MTLNAPMADLPGGPVARRPLQFIWIADCSGSMGIDGKMNSLNTAIRECIPHMQTAASANPNAQVFVRALKFSNGATWHILNPTPVESFTWTNLTAGGVTDMGRALSLVAEALSLSHMPPRGLPPVLVLISDGQPTDDFQRGLTELLAQPWGEKAVRISIAIGSDADHGPLQRFIGPRFPEIPVLTAHNGQDLVNFIRWASTAVLAAASAPVAGPMNAVSPTPATIHIPVPAPAPTTPAGIATDPATGEPEIW